ncbi:MAG: Ig-like domain-containing protein [Patescibacteria group bacterium]
MPVRRLLHIFVMFTTVLWSVGFSLLAPNVAWAAVTPTVTSLINFGNNRAKAASTPAAAIKMVIAVSNAEKLAAVTVVATDSGSTSFVPATDLAALATTAASGIALYNDAGASVGSFDSGDTAVALSGITAWSSGSTTLTLNALTNAGTFYIVYRTAADAVNNHGFVLTIPTTGIATDSASPTITPVSTNPITIDTTLPTLNVNTTGPANNSIDVPISAFIHVGFSENLDQSTVNPSNVTFTAGGAPVASGIRTFPDGFDVNVSSPPTFAASSRFSKVAGTSTAFYNIMGGQTIAPQPPSGYSVPSVSNIVITQRETFPPEVGVVTDATMTGGIFAINGFSAFGGQQITKFGTFGGGTSSPVNLTTTSITTGEVVVAYTAANPTGAKYDWHMVTTGAAGAAHADLRLDGASAAPTYGTHPGGGVSRYSSITPTDTSAVNGASAVVGTANSGINFAVGDMVFAKITANGDNLNNYAWHIVTAAENITTDSAGTTLRFDGASSLPAFAASSQVSKFAFGAQGAVSDSTALSFGDLVLAKTTANASNNNSYAFHIVNGADAVNGTALRFDNFPGSLTPSTTYVVTATTGVKDTAGNALASNQVVTFTTGATGGTNTTPPVVQSSIPQSGNQTFPPNGLIKLTFSVDMSTTGGVGGVNSVTNPANVGLFLDNFGAPGAAVTATNSYDSATRTVTITPATNLTVNTGYVVRVLTATQSSTSAPMTNSYFLAFRTASAVDSTAPTVLGVSPANASSSISRSTAVSIGFSKDMDPSTISTTTVKLEKASDSSVVSGTVVYNSSNRSATFSSSTLLLGGEQYRGRVVAGASGAKSVSAIQLGAATPANDYTWTFTTDNVTDSTGPNVAFSSADNFGLAVTFNEQVKTGGGPSAADNVVNYSLESPVGSSISLAGKAVTYDGGTKTARITGLSLQNGNTYKITVATPVQDLAGNGILITGTPPANTSFGTVANSDITGGQLGPGSGMIDPSMQGMNPTRVTPMNRAAGATSNYKLEFLAATSIPATGQIALTFPSGFNVGGAGKAVAGTASFCNSDINGPATGVVTLGTVSGDSASGTVTINTAGAATGANAFICVDLTGIVNSTIPSSTGYTVDIKTKDTTANNRLILESKTSAPFFLGTTGANTLTVNVFKDASPFNGNNDSGEGINGVTVFLFSPATGGQEATTALNVVNGVATFSNLANGDYMVGVKPTAAINVAFNSAPQPISISGNTIKNFALSNVTAKTIAGTVYGPASTTVDVFANSQTGFAKVTVTTNSTPVTVNSVVYGGSVAYSLPVSLNTTYNVGVGPAMPESFFTPGAPPPPPPDFTFMPPANLQVQVVESDVAGKNFTLSTAGKTITGTVVDSSGTTGVSGAGVFCRPVASSTTGSASGFGTGTQTSTTGAFTVKVTEGVYLCGVFKPGMPPVADRQITVGAAANTPSTLTFTLDAGTTSLTISGTVKDDAGNAISYAGVAGRKVVSSSDTTAVGGDSSNFVGGPTDANGAYTLYVSAGTWVVEAFAPGFGRLGTKTIVVSSSNATGQDFSAQTMTFRTITGTATRGGTATQGVMVRAEGASGGNMTSAASDGTYTIKVPDGTYNVSCYFPGLGDIAATGGAVTLSSDNTTAVRSCTAGTPIIITVNVTDGTNPITNAGVDVRDSNGRGNFTNVSTISSPNAVYTVSVPPGTYTVRVGHPAYGKIGETTAVSTTQTITHTATAGATFAVTGTVTGDGSNLANAWVSLIGTPTGSTNIVSLGGQTIANGTFSINVPAGSYRLRVDKPGYRSPAESTVAVTAATAAGIIALTTAAKTITGTISIAGSGVSNAFVDASDSLGGYAVAQTNSSGVYSLAVDTGTWTVRARASGYEGGPLPVVVGASSVTGQHLALTAISGFTVKPEKPETVTPTAGGFLTNSDIGANFKMNIPANALGTGSNAATVTTKINTGMPNPPSGAILSKNAITITAVDSSGQKVSSLNDNVTITVPYDEANLPLGALEANLVIGAWNDATQTYDTLTTTVDTTNNTLTATVTHFSDFAPLSPSNSSTPATPSGLAATTAGSSQINLTWTQTSNATSYDIYRSTSLSGTYSRIGSEPTVSSGSTTAYSNTGLTGGTAYFYKITALNGSGESAASSAVNATTAAAAGGGGSSSYTPPADTTPPTNLSVVIAGGALTTTTTSVTLTIGATDAAQMMISNVSDFSGATWETYAISKTWTLLTGDGVKTVYAKFRDAALNISTAVSDTITLNTSGTATPADTAPTTVVPPVTTPVPVTLPATASERAQQVVTIGQEASTVSTNSAESLAQAVGKSRDKGLEQRYESTIVARVVVANTPAADKAKVLSFVTYGTPTTTILGAGERAGVVNSFRAAFGKVPTAESDWADVIKIANGRFPGTLNVARETAMNATFKKIYLRSANRASANDDAAITVMAYGLRTATRNLTSEKAAINSFKAIYGKVPTSASDWDAVRAIAYSGAKR